MKQAYALLEEARQLIGDPENKITIAKLAKESDIHDPTLRNLLKAGTTNRTLDNLAKLEDAIARVCKEMGIPRPSSSGKNKARKET